jgi:hypothetical protein
VISVKSVVSKFGSGQRPGCATKECGNNKFGIWESAAWNLEQKSTEETEKKLSVFSVYSVGSFPVGSEKG